MPIGLIKKIAKRLIGKAAGKEAEDSKGVRAGGRAASDGAKQRREGRGTGGPRRGVGGSQDNVQQRRNDKRTSNAPRRDGAARPKNGGAAQRGGDGRRPASAVQRGGDGRRSAPDGLQHPAPTGRPVARPPSQDRRGRRPADQRGGPVSAGQPTAPGAHRPGGAVPEEELAKRRIEHQAWSLEQYAVEPAEGKMRFHDLDLPPEVMHAVADLGFSYCTPIQAMSLEHALAGKNIAGRAQTGTGKTAAFLIAILTRYLRSPEARQAKGGAPRALVIAPTRELVIQICKDAAAVGKYCGLRSLAVYGGMDYDRQKREVTDAPVDLLVATPGRLLDFVRSRVVDLSKVDTLVIDEADRMLDMGFIPDVRSIIRRLPPKEKRCTMLYSATLSEDVMRLASQWMEAPVRVEVEPESVATKSVKQIVYVVTSEEKFTVLYNHIQSFPDSRMLIFCNRRSTTEDVADSLTRRGIRCEMLSGDVNQNRRLRVLEDFRSGKVRIVVATDVAGRGLHVDDIGFVVNFDFPYEPEDYVHRIGRTGRAGASGTAISFADEDESFIIPEIEKFINEELKCTVLQGDDPLLAKLPPRNSKRDLNMLQPQRGGQVQDPCGHNVPADAKADDAACAKTDGSDVAKAKVQHEDGAALPAARLISRPAETSDRRKTGAARPDSPFSHRRDPAPLVPPSVVRPGGVGRPPKYSAEWVPGQGSSPD